MSGSPPALGPGDSQAPSVPGRQKSGSPPASVLGDPGGSLVPSVSEKEMTGFPPALGDPGGSQVPSVLGKEMSGSPPALEGESGTVSNDVENPATSAKGKKTYLETMTEMGGMERRKQQSTEDGDHNDLHKDAAIASKRKEEKEVQSYENAHKNNLQMPTKNHDNTNSEGILDGEKDFADGIKKDVKEGQDEDSRVTKNAGDEKGGNAMNGRNRKANDKRPQETKHIDNVAKHIDSGSQDNFDVEKDAAPKSHVDDSTEESASEEDDDGNAHLMQFTVILSGNHTIIAPEGEEALKWRFLFDCPHTLKELNEDPVMVGTRLKYKKGTAPSICHKKSNRTFRNQVEEILKRLVKHVQIYHTVISDEAVTKFWEALSLVELFKTKTVITYKVERNLYICSKTEHMDQAMKQVTNAKKFVLGLISKTEKLPLQDIPLQLMKKWMKVHMPADTSDIECELREDQKYMHITGLESVIIKQKVKIQNLFGKAIKRIYKTGKCATHLLFFEESVVVKYIEEILQEQKLVCIWETSKADCSIVVTAFDDEICEKAHKVIDAACVTKSISLQVDATTRILLGAAWEQEVSTICTKLKGKMKIWLDKEQDILEYVHTHDLKDKVQDEVQGIVDKWEREKYLSVDKTIAEHHERNKQKLTSLEKKHSVTISIKKNDLIIKGMEKNIQQTLEELKSACSAILKPNHEAVKPLFSWKTFDCFRIPESNKAELILLRDFSTVFINENSDEVKLEAPETHTEVIEIIPDFTLQVGTEEITADMVLPTDNSKRPVKFCCPKWNDGRSKEKNNLEIALSHLFKLINDLSSEALLEVQGSKIGNWQIQKLLKHILVSYQKHVKAYRGLVRFFLLVRDEQLYGIVRRVVSDQYAENPVTKADNTPRKEDEIPTGDPRVLSMTTTSMKYIQICVAKGEMTERKEDVLVNSAHQSLNLSKGKVSQSILKAAGENIQNDCTRLYPNGILPGQVAVTSAYNLQASKFIFHGAFEKWNSQNEDKLKRTLKEFVTRCLQKADEKKMKTIAFPAIGTGNLIYPNKVVADCMFEAVEKYSQTSRSTNIEGVFFVIYFEDISTLTAFDERMKTHEKMTEGSSVDSVPPFPYQGAIPKTKPALSPSPPDQHKPPMGARPKTKPAPSPPDQHKPPMKEKLAQPDPGKEETLSINEDELTEEQCLENSEVLISQELMEKIEKGSPEEIIKKYKVNIEYTTCSIKGELESLQKLEGYLRNLNGGYMEEGLSSATDEADDEFVSFWHGQAVENISQVNYQMFRYFFNDLYVSFLEEDIELNFSVEARVLHVHGEDQEAVDKATDDIRRAFDEIHKFQESDLSIKKEQFEYARHLLMEMNNSFPERKVYCYIHDNDPFTIHISARTWEEVKSAKHKMNFKLGSFTTTCHKKRSDNTPFDKNDNELFASVSSESLHRDIARKSFTTAEGIKVFVYNCSIIQAQVDVIVNAANEDLKHGGGVAKVIANAAGKEFIQECHTYIKDNGFLNVGTVCVTSGGKLRYPFVIHTLGPKWESYSKTSEGLQKCMKDLFSAVIHCFLKAETLQVQSVALPAVSSGSSGVPMEICAFQYLSAVLKYSKSVKVIGSLKEIHFIDVNDAILDLITLAFSASFNDDKAASEQFDNKLKKVLPIFEQSSVSKKFRFIPFLKKGGHILEKVAPYYKMDKKKSELNFSKILKVLIYIGDITDCKCKAIVSSEDESFRSQVGVAKAIRAKAGQKFDACVAKNRGQLWKVGDLLEADAGNLKCKKVVCCVVPNWKSKMSDEDYRKQLEQCFKNIMEKAKTYKSVALPLIGTGSKGARIEICGTVLLDSLLRFSGTHREIETIREVHIVSLHDESIACVRSIFMDYFDGQKKLDAERGQPEYMQVGSAASERKDPPPSKPKAAENLVSSSLGSNQPLGAQKMDRGRDDKQDKCVICMSPFNNPVKMKKCGHEFCKACIDTKLQHKPVCPTCNTIYEVITGNQPAGKMTVYINTTKYLPGYKDCGIIEITYHFLDGIQSAEHPKPGYPYRGWTRTAYLPNNEKGQKVLRLLRLAFNQRLIFTIGQSTTLGKDYMVIWSDIHHKTTIYSDPQRSSYPDPTYLDRVLKELAAKGVTEESVSINQWTSSAYERVERVSFV